MTVHNDGTGRAYWLALLTPAVLLAGAYIGQYAFGLPPCEMCWWQRYPHFAALTLAVIALFVRSKALIALAALAIAASGFIGGFHAGVENGWWKGLTACTSNAFGAGGDPLAAILAAPVVRCDVAPWALFGVSLAGWNFLISVSAALTIWVQLQRGRSSHHG